MKCFVPSVAQKITKTQLPTTTVIKFRNHCFLLPLVSTYYTIPNFVRGVVPYCPPIRCYKASSFWSRIISILALCARKVTAVNSLNPIASFDCYNNQQQYIQRRHSVVTQSFQRHVYNIPSSSSSLSLIQNNNNKMEPMDSPPNGDVGVTINDTVEKGIPNVRI